jgi:hypothetical protein
MESFLFITKDVKVISFEETVEKKGALIEVTALELEKVSQNNPPTMYRLEDGDMIAASLVGSPVYFGTLWTGRHDKNKECIGEVESTKNLGTKIKAWVRVTSKDIIERLKKGIKFKFSVGGNAEFSEIVKKAGRNVVRMVKAVCNHLQMVDNNVIVGFPNAKLDRVVEINESVMFFDPDEMISEDVAERTIESGIERAIGEVISRRYM